MIKRSNHSKENIELAPSDWLFWKDEEFNNWRRQNDFPRIVDFLLDTLPYFSLWLSEQVGLTKNDLLFHGPSRFIKYYGDNVTYIEHDIGASLLKDLPAGKVVKYKFLKSREAKTLVHYRVLRRIDFESYFDWAFSRKEWVFPNKIKDIREMVVCFTPTGIVSTKSNYLDSKSSIDLNIPLFMPSFTFESTRSIRMVKAPPRLELLKLGGGGEEIIDGLIGEKNLEFTNIDNLTLVSPIITSFQTIAFSTLRNFKVFGEIHAVTFYQCSIEMFVESGSLSSCEFEYCNNKIELKGSRFSESSIKARRLNLKLSETELFDCNFEYSGLYNFSSKEKLAFHKSAKMIFSHLGYPDLAGEHFLIQKKSERRNSWEVFSKIKSATGAWGRLCALFRFLWLTVQELYWGYGERPRNLILSALVFIATTSLFGYYAQSSSTHSDALMSIAFAFKSYTNITISEINQTSKELNVLGAVMSFLGLMSVGLLVASLSSKTKDYN